MKTVQIDAGRNNICYLIDAKACHIVSQLYSVTPISARRMLDFEGMLKEYKKHRILVCIAQWAYL